MIDATRDAIDKARLRLYMSAQLLAPRRNIIRQTFGDASKRNLDMMFNVPGHQDPSLCKLLGHQGYVSYVTFSSDCGGLASGYDDETVRLCDMYTVT